MTQEVVHDGQSTGRAYDGHGWGHSHTREVNAITFRMIRGGHQLGRGSSGNDSFHIRAIRGQESRGGSTGEN